MDAEEKKILLARKDKAVEALIHAFWQLNSGRGKSNVTKMVCQALVNIENSLEIYDMEKNKKLLLERKDAALDEIKYVLRRFYPECSEDIISDRVKFFWDQLDFIVELNN